MSDNFQHLAQKNTFDSSGRFILDDFDHKRPFSSFLPGIAGLYGIPMWVFYVNRGQAVCSFGVENKDHPILEFQSANKAYQTAAITGFRSFFNGAREGQSWAREVFSPWQAQDASRTMYIGMNEVEIEEINPSLGYQVNVLYYMLPNLPFSGLVRRVNIRNLGDTPLELEILDGLPVIVPYGVADGALKNIGRTIEAWMQVDNLENKLPYYRLKATPGDTAAVHEIESGNYALAFYKGERLSPLADPGVIFGLDTSFSRAHRFHDQGLAQILSTPQVLEGRSLSAFFGTQLNIDPGAAQFITSFYGYAQSVSTVSSYIGSLGAKDYINQKLWEARSLPVELTNSINTKSASAAFDGYCRQTFLDNLLRGGYPLVLGKQAITHVYSRKHGDIERDYNYFVIAPEYYSQGNGNYRDINQNRRNDVFFVPQAGEFNIRLFMSLIQADGYNPLVINGLTYSIPERKRLVIQVQVGECQALHDLLCGAFTPGQVARVVIEKIGKHRVEELLNLVFSDAEPQIQAEHGEGYWTDHWTYNLDLIESYLAVYPDKRMDLFFNAAPLPFFDNTHRVQPRKQRFTLYDGKPRQLNVVVIDKEKSQLINAREINPQWARTANGTGDIFKLPLISKFLLLALIKFATRDPSGFGIQMEAGRPGWYDALNGLPGLFGSSMAETYELLRLVNFLKDLMGETSPQVSLPVEARVLLAVIDALNLSVWEPFELWEKMTDALENYREATRLGLDGGVIYLDPGKCLSIMQRSLEAGIEAAETISGDIPPTYFIHEVTDFSLTGTKDQQGNPYLTVHAFDAKSLPPFLEGPVRRMKISNLEQIKDIHLHVKQSELFDRELLMYKVNASLRKQSHEIGRARAFTPGWLENESIWLHMAFKYLLEVQKAGLYSIFFEELANHLPAFKEVEDYGRSPLENSSFIVSSAHPDQSLHGAGFVARLSGSTAEFLSMWVNMTAGLHPFRVEKGQLVLEIKPALPAWLFREDGVFSFCFLGTCLVKLHNPLRRDTYASDALIKHILLHTQEGMVKVDGSVIINPYAEAVRRGEIASIELFY